MESTFLSAVKAELESDVTGVEYTINFNDNRIHSRTERQQNTLCELYTEHFQNENLVEKSHVFVDVSENDYFDYSDTLGEYQWVRKNFPPGASINEVSEHPNFCELLVRLYEDGMNRTANEEYMYESNMPSNGVIVALRELFEDDGSLISHVQEIESRINIDSDKPSVCDGMIKIMTDKVVFELSFEFYRPPSVEIPYDVKENATDLEKLAQSSLERDA